MDKIKISGGRRLQGKIAIGGAKNAALPLMAAALLTDETLTLSNLPHLADITSMANLLAQHGVALHLNGHAPNGGHTGRVLEMTAKEITSTTAPYDLVRKMRASVLVLGPIVARCGIARVSLPGGCAIGNRPVDLHLKALEAMGAEIHLAEGYIEARAPEGLKGGHILFPQVSVGATENALMAASLADGVVTIANAAREPEVSDLAHCLVAMGAEIEGIGTDTLKVTGKPRLHGAEYSVVPDRIETGTFLVAAAVTGGDIRCLQADPAELEVVLDKLREAGAEVSTGPDWIRVNMTGRKLKAVNIKTVPHPGFPTDMQAQFTVLNVVAEGVGMITETIFENRFMHVPELQRMGAKISLEGNTAVCQHTDTLTAAQVMATDLRASASLVIAGLVAQGTTVVDRIYHIDRGYEHIESKLKKLGAQIERVNAA